MFIKKPAHQAGLSSLQNKKFLKADEAALFSGILTGFKNFFICLHIYILSVCKNILFSDTRLNVNNFFVIFAPQY
ncbi:MAG TPA: hypothetical protein DDW27_21345 [Bacteroidales bacterium]|nr:hypothetical protein [Bacteroidales bacterium]